MACRSEKTRVGKELSGPLFSTLVGLAASNLNIIPVSARTLCLEDLPG